MALGLSENRFRTGVANHDWLPYLGVWRQAKHPDSYEAKTWAALLRAGAGARITAHTTLAIRGLEIPERVVLTIPATRRVDVAHAIILRDSRGASRTQVINGFPSVQRERAVIDAIRISPEVEAKAIQHEALRLAWINTHDLEAGCEELAKHRGLRQLRELASYAKTGSLAESERVLGRIIRQSGLRGWTFNTPIYSERGHLIAIADAMHQATRLVVEVDGRAWHTTVERFQRDRTRQNALVNAGWTVLRFTWEDLIERPAYVVQQLRLALSRSVR